MVKAMNVFQFSGVSLSYGENEILRELDFSIGGGEIIGILGPNGSGKTTLLKMMAGVLPPQSGRIQFMGKDLPDYGRQDIARRLSVLPQDTVIDFPFTALEIVLMGRAPYLKNFQWESARDYQIAKANMEITDCWEFAGRDIRYLSGGERERVLLARALTQEPEVLLLDEPTTHLDLKHWLDIFRLLKKLNQERGLTIVLVLHDLNFASLICGRILLLADREIKAQGTPEAVLKPDIIETIYGTPMLRGTYLDSGRPIFLPRLD